MDKVNLALKSELIRRFGSQVEAARLSVSLQPVPAAVGYVAR